MALIDDIQIVLERVGQHIQDYDAQGNPEDIDYTQGLDDVYSQVVTACLPYWLTAWGTALRERYIKKCPTCRCVKYEFRECSCCLFTLEPCEMEL